jgi:hypothetical protein
MNKGKIIFYKKFIYFLELCCAICHFRNLHLGHKLIEITEEESLKEENITIESSTKEYNKVIEKTIDLKNTIEKEITEIDNLFDKVNNEVTSSFVQKHEALTKQENDLKEDLQNNVTKVKEKLEIYLSESNRLIKLSEKINKGIKSLEKDSEKSKIKILSYISNINKNKKEILSLLGKLIKNINISYNEEKDQINFDNYYFNGVYIPKNFKNEDISSNSIKLFWEIDNFNIENLDKNKLEFKVEIRKQNSNEKFIKVYEGSNYNCIIDNLIKSTYYEIRICSKYNDIFGEWSDIYQIKTDFISESKILNKEDKNKLLNLLSPVANGKNIYLKLIYRRGGDMSYETFHSKCDNKGSTVVLCKAKNEKFGGYTNVNWESVNGVGKYVDEPFLFNINSNKKLNYTNKIFPAVFLHKDHGPDFNWDFVFNSENNKMKTCQCTNKVSGVYLYSNGPITGDGSSNHIEVDEVEVFKFKVY